MWGVVLLRPNYITYNQSLIEDRGPTSANLGEVRVAGNEFIPAFAFRGPADHDTNGQRLHGVESGRRKGEVVR